MSGLSEEQGPRVPKARIVAVVVAMGLLAVAAGAAWAGLAEPPAWQVSERGIVLTEEASGRQVGVELLFVAIGVVVSLGWALVAATVLRRLGWVLVPLVVASTALASVVAWRVGLLMGPGDPAKTVDPQIGDALPAQLAVDALGSFLVWPIAGLVGLLLATWAVGRRDADDDVSAPGVPTPPT